MTEKQVIDYIKKHKKIESVIQANVKMLTPAVQQAALDYCEDFEDLINIPGFIPTQRAQIKLVKWDWQNIRKINNPSYTVQMRAVKQRPWSVGIIKNLLPKVRDYVIYWYPKAGIYLNDPTQEQLALRLRRGARGAIVKAKEFGFNIHDIIMKANAAHEAWKRKRQYNHQPHDGHNEIDVDNRQE